MKYRVATSFLLLAGVASASHAQRVDPRAAGARLDGAIVAGRAQAFGIAGPRTVTRSSTSACTTHLVAGKESWDIDWKTATIDDESSATDLDITMGRPDAVFALSFGDRTQLRAARLAAKQLAAACAK